MDMIIHVYMLNLGICYKKKPFSRQLLFLALGCTQCLFKTGLGGASGGMEPSTNSTGKGHQLIEIASLMKV